MGGSSSRLGFLESLGLSHDPFVTPVAEQEIGLSHDIPVFYSYYLHPTYLPSRKSINENLLRQLEQNVFIYGEPGSGKTTLKFTIEAECRTRLEKTLAVSYLLGEDIEVPPSSDEHGKRLAKSIAISLFIQIIEQFNSSEGFPDKKLIDVLKRQFKLGGRHLQRLLSLILDRPVPNTRAGISSHWRVIGEIPVKYVSKTKVLIELLNKCVDLEGVNGKDLLGWDLVAQGFHAARLWGFRRILIMVDGVDTRQRVPKTMLALVRPLFEKLISLAAQDVYFRFFLPLEIRKPVERELKEMTNDRLKSVKYMPIIIKWQKEALSGILAQRFWAAGSHLEGFDSLAEKGLQVDRKLVAAAQGSPRRLLRLASALIDEYLARKPGDSKISEQDWKRAQIAVASSTVPFSTADGQT